MDRYSVLVIEDDEKIAQLLKVYLEDSKFHVSVAYDGNQGWKLFQEQKPTVVVLDLMLPGLDGWEICQRISRLQRYSYLNVNITRRNRRTGCRARYGG